MKHEIILETDISKTDLLKKIREMEVDMDNQYRILSRRILELENEVRKPYMSPLGQLKNRLT